MKNVLFIGGTDPLLGAGVGADQAVGRAHGVQPLVLETAFVCQNSQGVHQVQSHDPTLFIARLRAVETDVRVDGIKIGMLGCPRLADVLATALAWPAWAGVPVVLDPVLASGGAGTSPMAVSDMEEALVRLLPRVTLVTPNRSELERLSRRRVASHQEAFDAAMDGWGHRGCATLIKGGHFEPRGLDMLALPDAQGGTLLPVWEGTPWPVDIHGTGCHLASAIASRLACGASVLEACEQSSRWLHALVAAGAYLTLGRGRPQFDARRLGEGIALSVC